MSHIVPSTASINGVGVMLTPTGGLSPEGIIELAAQTIGQARLQDHEEYVRLLRGRNRKLFEEFLDKQDVTHREQAVAYGRAFGDACVAFIDEVAGVLYLEDPGVADGIQRLFSHWKRSIKAYYIRGWHWLDDVTRFSVTTGPEVVERYVHNARFEGIKKSLTGKYNITPSIPLQQFMAGLSSDHGNLIQGVSNGNQHR